MSNTKNCETCRFQTFAHSMRGIEEPFCRFHRKWIGTTIFCSDWERDVITKPKTNADRIRAMSDEELAHLLYSAEEHLFTGNLWNYEEWTAWLKQEVSDE